VKCLLRPSHGGCHPVDFPGALAASSRQQAPDFALVLEDIEMPPNHLLDMIVALYPPSAPRTAFTLPKMFRFADDQ
jgi:hypothetical protein